MSATRRNNKGLLLLAALLMVSGAALLLSSSHSTLTDWLMRLWPVFLVCAGIVRVMGFAAERKPRSPLGGMLLIIVGMLFFGNRLHPDLNVVEVYGRYWVVLLAVFAAIELVRYYSHPQVAGSPPKLFTAGKLVVILLIVSTGVLANRAAGNSSLVSALRLPRFLSGLRDSVVGPTYAFTDDPFVAANVAPDLRISVNNSYGSVKLTGGRPGVRAILAKGIRAWSQDDARKIADKIKLVVTQTPGGLEITTNRDQFSQQFTTDIQVEVPASATVTINDKYGSVSASGIRSPLAINASYGQVDLNDIKSDLNLVLSYSDVNALRIEGDIKVAGAKSARLSNVMGSLDLGASHGSVELRQISGTSQVNAPFCRITVQGLASEAELKTEHGSIEAEQTSALSITAPFSDVRVRDIGGDLYVASSNGKIQANDISGDLEVQAAQSSLSIDEVRGNVVVATTHGDVVVKNFYEGARVETSYRDVMLAPAGELAGDVDVENNHGEIKLVLPQTSRFELDAASENGLIKPVGFAELVQKGREVLVASRGSDGPAVKLRTSYKNIIIQASGPRQTQASAAVN
ncbi:MAG TPA: DUF4097 family beta strand repeat-containing protein [Blastocatellia bacterium]|nr:DUF4097 family beta strand repeat-containing protein [Blastocatellia bacterium]